MELTAEHIKKSYGRKQVLTDISFSAGKGSCLGFTGPNGCGKTTLLSILAGVEKADSGSISLDGRKISVFSSEWGRITGYLPQINPLPENMLVKECLNLWCDDGRFREKLMERYDLRDIQRERIDRLSGGMKRRCALCCAMAGRPQILIMDEPTAALDIHYKKLIHADMEDFVHSGGILLLVTHEKEEMEMCDECFFIRNGRNEKV